MLKPETVILVFLVSPVVGMIIFFAAVDIGNMIDLRRKKRK